MSLNLNVIDDRKLALLEKVDRPKSPRIPTIYRQTPRKSALFLSLRKGKYSKKQAKTQKMADVQFRVTAKWLYMIHQIVPNHALNSNKL